uniref:Coatomer subunit beta n=1 Tax=Strombidium inclinatum TaxID=197538 RepID=A0A7S3IM43_9SPIT|mmetsp:Transcript_24767/g.38553  ORF Transcript_24767/g.38553 Transcript_24767/m.38553 type:complete len:450 (+) Transcript_24767:1225-2574(+)
MFAIRGEKDQIKIYKNLQEYKVFQTGFTVQGIFGGRMLAAKGDDFITFYDWETQVVVRRVDVSPSPKNVFWNEAGSQVVLALEDNFYLLNFDNEGVAEYVAGKEPAGKPDEEEDGFEEAFQFQDEFQEIISSGLWVSNDCFVFINSKGHIYYMIGQKTMKLMNADRKQYILGYDGKLNRLYVIDKNLNISSYSLLLSLVNYQSAILNDDLHGADLFFKDIPETHYQKLAKFLESNDRKEMAFSITPDQDHKFDLAIALNKADDAFAIAEEQQSVEKWKKVGDIALLSGFFELAETCFKKSADFNSLLLFYSSYGDQAGLTTLLEQSEQAGKFNIAYEVAFILGQPESCVRVLVKSKRYSEAAMFAKTYCPSLVSGLLKDWEEMLKQNDLQYVPEDINQAEGFQEIMQKSAEVYSTQLVPNVYNQPKPPADEIEMFREKWNEDFEPGGAN